MDSNKILRYERKKLKMKKIKFKLVIDSHQHYRVLECLMEFIQMLALALCSVWALIVCNIVLYIPDCFLDFTEPSGMKAATMRAQMTNNAPNTKGGPGTRLGLLVT